jgi:hypothetical protein
VRHSRVASAPRAACSRHRRIALKQLSVADRDAFFAGRRPGSATPRGTVRGVSGRWYVREVRSQDGPRRHR